MNPYLKRIKNQLLLAIACTAVLGGCDIAGEDVVPASIADFRLVPDEIWDYRYPDGPSSINLDPLLNDSIKVEVNVKFGQPQHGSFFVDGTDTYYLPQEGFTGVDRFTYTVCSAKTCKTEEVLVYIDELPDPNTCVDALADDFVETTNDQWVDIQIFRNDRICSSNGVGVVTSHEGTGSHEVIWGHGTHPNNVVIRYYPDKNYVGQETITYGYCPDDCSNMLEATVTINIK
jgi:hypothetical protein